MLDFSKLLDGSIIICPNSVKKELVKIKSKDYPTKNVKFFSKEDLQEGFYFSYGLDAISYLHQKYHYDYDLAEEVLRNLHNITNINDKLSKLCNIYDDLVKNKLLTFNPSFKNIFTNKKVYIYCYPDFDVELENLLKLTNTDCEFISSEADSKYSRVCRCFSDIEQEVYYVMKKIGKLIKRGISLNNIYFYNIPSKYQLILKKQLLNHGIPFEDDSAIYLNETPIFKLYLNLLNEHSFADAYEVLKNDVKYDPFDTLGTLVDLIVDVKEINVSFEHQIELLIYAAKKTKVKKQEYLESIKIVNYDAVLSEEDYVFILGFSLGSYPIIYKDTEFYLDVEKKQLSRNTAILKNKIEEFNLINFIKRTRNLIITFKEKVDKAVYYPSLLIKKLHFKLKKGNITKYRYSLKSSNIEVAKYIDLNISYGAFNKWLNTFTKEELEYHIYDPSFKGVQSYDKNGLLELSYSKMKYYIECPFKYFLCKILKIDEFDGNFDTELGTLFHKILEDSLEKEIDLNNYIDDLNEKFVTNKERYFASKCLPQVLDVIAFNKEFDSTTSFKTILGEQEFKINLDANTIFTAQIDKLLYDEESKCVVVIDYKTGDFTFDPKLTTIGLHLQLPTYALIVKKVHPEFKTIGMYIENILLNKEDLKALNPYKLAGLTNSDIPMIQLIDPTFLQVDEDGKLITKSKFIRALQISKENIEKGLYNFTYPTNLKTEQEINDLEQLTHKHIMECVKKIRSGAFEISPIKDNGLHIDACKNCKFADVCCKTDANYRIMNLKESEAK